jgi:DNA polymerase-3 subunit alpha
MATVQGLVDKAIADGMKAIALTDHGNMFGAKEFYDCVNKKNKGKEKEDRFKPVLGVEAYCARRTRFDKKTKEDGSGWHLILLAKNKKGYQNLCKLVSKSWTEGFYYKPRIDKEILEKYSEGLIVCSACLGGEIPQKLMGHNAKNVDDEGSSGRTANTGDTALTPKNAVIERTVQESSKRDAEEAILWFKSIFGDDYYLEIQRHKTDQGSADHETYQRQKEVNEAILELAQKTGTKVIASNDVHFVNKEHADAHDRLICLSTGKDLDDPKRMRYTKQEWLKTQEEMNAIFEDVPEALSNTCEIIEKIEFYNINNEAIMPVFQIPETFGSVESYRKIYSEEDLKTEFNIEDDTRFDKLGGYEKVLRIKLDAEYLRSLTLEKAKHRYGHPLTEEMTERLNFELETMKTMGFPGYFLIVQDFIQAAKEMGVAVGPGRGSAAGSAVAYCLGITEIDPMKYDLLFERFLNPDRISMPDIDIDFDDDGRAEVLRWVTDKYGKEKVAHIVTYGTMAAKSAIKDVARVQKLSLAESNKLSNMIPDRLPEDKSGNTIKINLSNCIKNVKELHEARYSDNQIISDTLKYAEMLEGTVRQVGVHACGIIIGADDLTNFVPLSTAKDKETFEELPVTQYDGSVIESVGLIKMDFLGLKTLSVIKEAIANIKHSKNIDIDIDKIPLDNKETYELYSRGDTVGTFQFESPGMQKYLRELKPTKFEDLIAMNALYRPGPMAYIPDFIDRKHGKKDITYDFPEMESRLKDTYGITVYQEQVMLLSRDIAGFTRGQSDELRKAMGKKLVDKMEALHTKFIQGAEQKGFGPKEKLEKIWSDWSEFAKYAFNKSHATCYSLLSYQTAYLKALHPAEFMAANLTRNKDNITEIAKFMDECRAMKIPVKGPDVNESEHNFTVTKTGDIRFGLGGVKNLGSSAVDAIIKERQTGGQFKSIFDFVERVNLNSCTKRAIEALAYSGGFDIFSEIRREQFFVKTGKGEENFTDVLIRYGNRYQTDKQTNVNSLFGAFDAAVIARPEVPQAEQWNTIEKLNRERDLVGIYLSSHPLDEYQLLFVHIFNHTLTDIETLKAEERLNHVITTGGIVTGYRTATTKKGVPYGILKLEDYAGSIELPLFSDDYKAWSGYGVVNAILMIRGKIQSSKYGNNTEFRVQHIEPLTPTLAASLMHYVTIDLPLHSLSPEFIGELSAQLKSRPGSSVLHFTIHDPLKNITLDLHSDIRKVKIDSALVRFLEENAIKFSINN